MVVQLTNEKFQEIYTNERLRNQVAYAHDCLDSGGNFKYKSTTSYPTRYAVTDEQIKLAKEELQRAKQKTYDEHKNDLLFIGMGMEYKPKEGDDIGNHRIRTTFKTSKGEVYSIEFCKVMNTNKIHTNYAIYYNGNEEEYNAKNLEFGISDASIAGRKTRPNLGEYTRENILKIINEKFDCNFKNIVIDNYNISPHDDNKIICESPQTN